MKCPECGTNHRSKFKAEQCNHQVENEWGHYITRKEAMEIYLASFKPDNNDEDRSLEGWAKIILGR